MTDIGISVLNRLKNKAKVRGISYQLCLQLFCQEEFLRRLTKSEFSENLVLKGGLFIYAITNFDSRITVDIDFMLRKMPNTPEKVNEVLEKIINTSSGNDYITFEITNVYPISLEKKYAGIGASLIARIKNTRTPFNIDFGVGDVIVPKSEKRNIPTQLVGFEAPRVNTYSIETTIAEKIDAILNLMEYSSRMKDYYDIYYLASKFDYDGNILVTAMRETFSNRNHIFTIEQFNKMVSFSKDEFMKKKWVAFTKKKVSSNDNFDEVMKIIDIFLKEPMTAVINNIPFPKIWRASQICWCEESGTDIIVNKSENKK